MSAIVPFVYFQGICFGLFSLMKPSKPFFHCSILSELGWPISSQIPVKIYECYMFFNCWHVIVSVWLAISVPTYVLARMPFQLVQPEDEQLYLTHKQLKVKKSRNPTQNYPTTDELRHISNSLPTYLHLVILCNRFNAVSRIWITGVSFFTGKLVAIYMGFATILLAIQQTLPWKEYMAYPTSCLFLGLLFAFVSPQAEALHTFSSAYIHQVKAQPNRVIRKIAQSLQPMAVWLLDILYFEMGTGIEMLHDIIGEIGDLLVGFLE